MKIKRKIFLLLLITILLSFFVFAAEITEGDSPEEDPIVIYVSTHNASDINYHSATFGGKITDEGFWVDSYGIQLWADGVSLTEIELGQGSPEESFYGSAYLLDDTTYSYRAYAVDFFGKYWYGATRTVTTPKREMKETPTVNFNIPVESLDSIDFEATPNKFLLNNLILNKQDTLQLVAGNNFNGIPGILGSGGENIFINQYFINKYNTNPVLKALLSFFDCAVYNLGDFVWSGATDILAEAVFFSPLDPLKFLLPDSVEETLGLNELAPGELFARTFGDMRIKRFTGSISEVLSHDYVSSDKRSFGYEQGRYKYINALTKGTKTTKNLIKSFLDGKETIHSGIEAYQGYYFENILPAYGNARNNLLQANRYLVENCDKMSSEEIAEYVGYAHEYADEISSYEKYEFADEAARKWKIDIEASWWGKEVTSTLNALGKTLSFASSSMETIQLLNQVIDNKDQLYGVFDRLSDTTDNAKLELTLENLKNKMDNAFPSLLMDTAANAFDTFAKDKVQKAAGEALIKGGKHLASTYIKSYSAMAVDAALSKASYVLLALEAGGFLSNGISNTENLLEYAIEAKYLWNIENESKELLQKDLSAYAGNPTEENAKAVMDDLFWIKALKLRQLEVTKEIYEANTKNIVSFFNPELKEIAEGVDKLYQSQTDALIAASLTESIYTMEEFVLEDGETYMVYDYDPSTGHDGLINTSDGITSLSNAASRLSGGVVLKSGSSLSIDTSGTSVYIPYITMEPGAVLLIDGAKVTIGDGTEIGGIISVTNGATLDIQTKLTSDTANINIDSSTLTVRGDLTLNQLDMGTATVEVLGSFSAKNFESTNSEATFHATGDFSITNGGTCHTYCNTLTVDGNASVDGTMIVEGATFTVGGNLTLVKNAVMTILEGSANIGGALKLEDSSKLNFKTTTVTISGTLTLAKNANLNSEHSTVTIGGELTIEGIFNIYDSTITTATNVTTKTKGTVNLDSGTMTVNGVLSIYTNGKLTVGGGHLTVNGDLDTNGSIYVDTGSIDVNGSLSNYGQTLNVKYSIIDLNTGNIEANSFFIGTLNVGGGFVKSLGSFRTTEKLNMDCGKLETFGVLEAGCSLSMTNDSAYILSHSGFYAYGSTSTQTLTAGTIEVKGDFDEHSLYFTPSGTHKIILSGTETQRVEFEYNKYSHINILEVRNENIKFVNCTKINTIVNDEVHGIWKIRDMDFSQTNLPIFNGELWCDNVSLGSKTMTVNGDFKIGESCTTNIDLGNLVISGDFECGGTLNVGNGNVDVSGTFNGKMHVGWNHYSQCTVNMNNGRMQAKSFTSLHDLNVDNGYVKSLGGLYSDGTINMGCGTLEILGAFSVSSLSMTNDSAYILVHDYFYAYGSTSTQTLTAGTIEIKGDFMEYSAHFTPSGTHKVILSGTQKQTVRYYDPESSYFNLLEVQNENVEFLDYTKINTIVNDEVSGIWKIRDMDFSQTNLPVFNGELWCDNVSLGNKTMTVNGNLKCYDWLNMNIDDGNLIVNGNFTTNGTINVNTGRIDVNGTFYGYTKNNGTYRLGTINLNSGNLEADSLYVANLNVGNGYVKSLGYTSVEAELNMGSGTLEVLGDFYIHAFGAITMSNDSAYILIHGYFDSYRTDYELTAGTIEIKGDFSEDYNRFTPSGTHKVILSGTQKQTVRFDNPSSSHFNILIKRNPLATFPSNCYKELYDETVHMVVFDTGTDAGKVYKFVDKTATITITEQIAALGSLSKEGYELSGWYLDALYTIPLTSENDLISSDITVYAKWTQTESEEPEPPEETPSEAFGVRSAFIRNISYRDGDVTKYKVLLFAAIDTLNYREVGFEVTVNGKTRKDGTKTVYTSIIAKNSDGAKITIIPSDFGGSSAYIFGQAYNFGEAYKGMTLTFRPYAIDLNGNYIYGKETTVDKIYNKQEVTI